MARLKVALAGAGMVSRHHLLAWSQTPHAEVVAVADPDPQQRESRASEFAIHSTYAEAREMLEAEHIDALDIAAPMHAHGHLVHLAAERGIAVLCQKPLAGTLDQARQIAQDAAGKTRLMVHENWRFRPHYRRIASWLSEGRIGDPAFFRLEVLSSGLVDQPDGATPPALVRQPFLAEMGRLLVLELLVHHFDVLRFLFGPVTIERAHLGRLSPHVKGEDTAALSVTAGSARGTIFASMAAIGSPSRSSDSLYILGPRGRVSLRGSSLVLNTPHEERFPFDLATNYQASYTAAIGHFVECLLQNLPFETEPEVHLAALEAVERSYELAEWAVS